MSKLSGSSSTTITVVPTSAMAMVIIGILDTVRAEHVLAGIVKTASTIDHWLIGLYTDVLERAHHRRVCLLELL